MKIRESNSEEKFDEVIDAILDAGSFTILVNIDSFSRKGDSIEFRHVSEHGRERDPYDTYLRGYSTNPEVGDDLWSVDWIVTSLDRKKLTSGDSSIDSDIVSLYDEFNELYSDEESDD